MSPWLHTRDGGRRVWAWLGARDPGHGALRRAVRAAILMPGSFALCVRVIDNPTTATFAAFGSISMLLLVDFRGTIRDRMQSQAALVLVGAVLVCVGTLCSRSDVAAVAAMGIVGVAIIFSAVVSSVLAGATTSLLLGFILPVSLVGPASQIPDRVAGWGIAGGLSVLAVGLLWPAPVVDPLRGAATTACGALGARLRRPGSDPAGDRRSRDALDALSRVFLATPYRPTGLTTAARAGVRLVDELGWLGAIVLRSPSGPAAGSGSGSGSGAASAAATPPERVVAAVRTAAAAVLEHSAELLAEPLGSTDALTRARLALEAVTRALPDAVCLRRAVSPGGAPVAPDAEAFVSSLDPAFRAQETSFMVVQIAVNVEAVAVATSRSWPARALGRQPPGIGGPLASARERASAHLALSSVSLHNSLRGGAALAIAVLVARLIGVEHAFWVSFGTLSILRSNALSTGQTFARALLGTVAGFVVGAVLVLAIGTNTTLLWALLPVVVLIGGVAPAAISFLAGQAAFTVVLFILFNIIAPAGWRIGLVRIEDVALGGAASLVVGLLFWPRGAGAALGRALADAYDESARYLSSAVGFAVACCAPGIPQAGAGELPQAARAAAASRRLDDTFRTYLAERGPKRVPLAGVTTLVTGASALRLAGDAILALWDEETEPSQSRIGAARELLARARTTEAWFRSLRQALASGGPPPAPDPADPGADERLVATIDHDLRSPDGSATAAAVRVVWTGDHLDAVRRLERLLSEPVEEVVRVGALGR